MQMIIKALLVTSLIAGTFCQKIVFENTMFKSPCATGVRSGIDLYFIAGTIGENITDLLIQKWLNVVLIQMLKASSSQFVQICQFGINASKCVPSPADHCGCFYNTTTDQAHFTVNNTIQTDDNNAIIRAQWQHNNGTNIYSNGNYTLQEIYDVDDGHLALTVTGVTGNLTTSGLCSYSLSSNESNYLELCCSNTPEPCYPRISLNGAVVTGNAEMCVTYQTSRPASDVTRDLDLSYSVCNLNDYIKGRNCTETLNVGSACNILCSAVIAPVAVVIIVFSGIALYCYKTKKRPKAVPNHGTNENEDEAHSGEHHDKDRQNPEPIHQAYDGRRSRPSEVTIDGSANQTVPENPRQLPPLK